MGNSHRKDCIRIDPEVTHTDCRCPLFRPLAGSPFRASFRFEPALHPAGFAT